MAGLEPAMSHSAANGGGRPMSPVKSAPVSPRPKVGCVGVANWVCGGLVGGCFGGGEGVSCVHACR